MNDAGFNAHLISSVAFARTPEALHNSWDKNDPKDAQVMLYMLEQGNVQRYYDALEHGVKGWQELSKTHEAVSKKQDRDFASPEDALRASVLSRGRPVSTQLTFAVVLQVSERVSYLRADYGADKTGLHRRSMGHNGAEG
jgi:hypothetical protein